eukprot:gene10792-12575_t
MSAEFKKYETYTHGLSIDHPADWRVLENSGFSVALFTPQPVDGVESNVLNLNVSIQDLNAATQGRDIPSIEEFLEISKGQVVNMGAKDLKHGDTLIGKKRYPGYYMSYTLDNEGNLVKINQSFFILDTFTYVITLSTPAVMNDSEINYSEVYERAIQSFALFTPKGYKYMTLSANYIPIDIAVGDKKLSTKVSLFSPEGWAAGESTATTRTYKSPKDNLQLIYSVDSLPAAATADFDKWMESKLRRQAADRQVTVGHEGLDTLIPAENGYILGGNLVVPRATRFTYRTPASDDVEVITVVVGNAVVSSTLLTPAGEMPFWHNILEASVSSMVIAEVAEGAPKAAEHRMFAHLIKSYSFAIPLHFGVAAQFSTNEAIMFVSSMSSTPQPVFSITFEDIGSAVSHEDYKGLIMHFHTESLERPKLMSDKPSRMDRYKASTVEMTGYDQQMGPEILKAMFKCAVVKRRFGVLLSFRSLNSEFDKIYNASFFAFNSFKLLN